MRSRNTILLLRCTIAASLRLMMMSRAQTNAKTAGLKIPKDSMDVLMAKLRSIKAEKRRNSVLPDSRSRTRVIKVKDRLFC